MATKKKRLRKKKPGTLDTVKRALRNLFKPTGKKRKKKRKG